MESTRKLSNFNFQWTKTLMYQNNLRHIIKFTFLKGLRCNNYIVCNNTKENFLWEPEKRNVKFHKIAS